MDITTVIRTIKNFNIMANGNLYKIIGGVWVTIVGGAILKSKNKKTFKWDPRFNLESYEIKSKIYNRNISDNINSKRR